MHLIVDPTTSYIYRKFDTERGAKVSFAAMRKKKRYENTELTIVSLDYYNQNMRRTKIVRNLMTGKEVEIDVNTPRSCDVSQELYWTM